MNTTNKIIRRNHNRSKGYDLENEEKYNNDSHNTYVTVVVFSVGTYAYFAVSFHDAPASAPWFLRVVMFIQE